MDVHEISIPFSVRVPDVTLTSVFPDANWAAMVIVNCLRVSAVYVTVSIDAEMDDPLPNNTVALFEAVQDVMRMEYCDEDVPVLDRPVFPDECVAAELRMIAVERVKRELLHAPLSVSHESDSVPQFDTSSNPTG